MVDAPATTPAPSIARAPDFEASLPEAQRWINRTCENWIFAFLVAMVIRHFVVEAFRIPTASMEPMLYGDPGFLKGDHVVVDKLLFRFRGIHRWDVTVFQFPQPEIESGNDARPAVDADGNRLDIPMIRPLMFRNFVKRCVILPGDTFFIFGGDIFLKQPDGSFQPSRKPPAIQEALWQDVYRHGEQKDYLPWVAGTSCGVSAQGGILAFSTTEGGAVTFTQPFRNLYVKPGTVRVRKLPASGEGILVDVSMTKPQFTYDRGVVGNIWDLDNWEIQRLTSADIDNGAVARQDWLNAVQDEYVGDVRIAGTVTSLDGHPSVVLRQGKKQGVRLALSSEGWQLIGVDALAADKPLASGAETVVGKPFTLAHLDCQCLLTIGGKELARIDVPVLDPNDFNNRAALSISGIGSLAVSGLHIQRDVHYTKNYILKNEVQDRQKLEGDYANASGAELRDKLKSRIRDIDSVRHQFQAKDLNSEWGCSPETAITAPKGAYLMLGDNSPHSWDGRAWGWVPEENLRGRAFAVVMPFTRWRIVK